MHDCFGNELQVFDKVRFATREELDAHGHTDLYPVPGELVGGAGGARVLSLTPGAACCEAITVGAAARIVGNLNPGPAPAGQPSPYVFMVEVPGAVWAKACQLVKVDS